MCRTLGVLSAAADDRAEQHVVVAAEELRRAVEREVRATLEGLEVHGRGGGGVHDDRCGVRRRGLQVGQREQRVRGRLDPDEVGAVGRRSGLVELDVVEPPAAEQRERADRPVVRVLRDRDALPGLEQGEDQRGRRARAGREQQRGATLELPERGLGRRRP